MLATAYETGGNAGQLVVYALLTAIGYTLVRRLVRGSFGSGFARSPAGTVLGLVVVGALMIFRLAGSIGDDDMSKARAGIVAGCTNQGATASLCDCYADQLMKRTDNDFDKLAALQQKMLRAQDAGQAMPAPLRESVAACVGAEPDAPKS